MHQILTAVLASITLPVLWSCSDDSGFVDPNKPGAMTITVVNGEGDGSSTRANDGDPEFLIGQTTLYFYRTEATDEEPILEKEYNFNAYTTGTATIGLTEKELGILFPDGTTTCYVYALSNMPSTSTSDPSWRKSDYPEKHTIENLKKIEIASDFTMDQTSFVMDGTGEITLNTESSTTSGTIILRRAAAKVMLTLAIQSTVTIPDDGTYEPVLQTDGTEGLDSYKIYGRIHNAPSNGLVDGALEKELLNLTSYDRYYKLRWVFGKYAYYYNDYFYLYPYSWDKSSGENVQVSVYIPWRRTDATTGNISYVWYYYQIPINRDGNEIVRNAFYNAQVNISVLGGKLNGNSTDPIEAEPLDLTYSISDWNSSSINADLDRSHYLMVQSNTFEVFNQDEVTFEYNACSSVTAYLKSIKYESTKYGTDVYLYKTEYQKDADNPYPEVTGEKTNSSDTLTYDNAYNYYDTEVRTQYSEVVKYINAHYDKTGRTAASDSALITITDMGEDESSESNNGRITLNAPVQKMAGAVFRPLVYTIVVMTGTDHNSYQQTVTITQYPSKYVDYGDADNVFVNGYFARKNGSYSTQSYPFTYAYWDSTNSRYYSNSKESSNMQIFGYLANNDTQIKDYSAVTTSYEYLQGSVQLNLKLKKTINVHVTAFTPNDHTFTITKDNTTEELTYRLGDPRVEGNYTADDKHMTDSYDRNSQRLYDYYESSGSHKDQSYGYSTTYYDRYVKSWGENARKIKIGGTDESYDNIIAPLYKIQSPYGALIGTAFFDVAQKRCATYQEAGFPAGRWRLPTLAEIAFIVYLQNKNVIETLFIEDATGYWTSSGGKVYISKKKYYYTPKYSETSIKKDNRTWDAFCFTRCVYDLWYWGVDPESDPTTYNPKPYK